jgi:hypothetical protein
MAVLKGHPSPPPEYASNNGLATFVNHLPLTFIRRLHAHDGNHILYGTAGGTA